MIKLFGPFQKNCKEPGIFELETVRLTKRRCKKGLQSDSLYTPKNEFVLYCPRLNVPLS